MSQKKDKKTPSDRSPSGWKHPGRSSKGGARDGDASAPKEPPPKPTNPLPPLPPPPPDWAGIGAPEPVEPQQDSEQPILLDNPVRQAPVIRTLDEQTFMQECADRLNGFLVTYPEEAQHVLRTFVKYKYEMVEIHQALRARSRERRGQPPLSDEDGFAPEPGVTFAALFGAVLQTHHGTGWYLKPVLIPDPDGGVGQSLIVRFEVARQEEEGDGPV